MKNKNMLKILFDGFMLLILVSIFATGFSDHIVHDILGLCLLILLAVHLIYNRRWIAHTFKKRKELNGKPKKLYRINLRLGFAFSLTLLSGIAVSSIFFDAGGAWKAIHFLSALVFVVLIGFHLRLHHQLIKTVFKN